MKTTEENQRHCSGPQSNVWLGYIITLLLTWRNNLRYFQWWNHFTALICHHIISPPWKENVKCSLQWHFYWILTKEYKAFPDRLKNWSRSITGLIFFRSGLIKCFFLLFTWPAETNTRQTLSDPNHKLPQNVSPILQ